jgi:glycosyltransferase involved in cell wall biosynthesis
MNIAHITAYLDPNQGYEENFLGPAQSELGANVTIIASNMSPGSQVAGGEFEVGASDYRGVNLQRLKTFGFSKRQPTFGLRKLKATLDELKPDVVHLHSPVGLLLVQALRACKSLEIPVVLDSHLCYFNLRPYGWLKRRYYDLHRKFVFPRYRNQIKALLPLTPESGDLLERELGLDHKLMVHNTLGTTADQFVRDLEPRNEIRDNLQISQSAHVVMFVGRVVPEKRVETLIKAFASVNPSETHLVVVGPVAESYKQSLTAVADEESRERITFTGGVDHDDLPKYFSAADIGVWPGDGAISIIDAMACSLPVIITRTESTSHLISSGSGVVFTEGDSEDLSRVLGDLLSDQSKLTAMSGLSRQAVESVFDWPRVASRTIEIYKDVLSNRTSSVPALW